MLGMLHGTQSAPNTFPGNYFWFTVSHPEYAPHALFDPMTKERAFFVPPDRPSKSLRNLAGGVETNNRPGGVYQVEIVGMSQDFGQYPDWWYDNLREFLREIEAMTGIKPVFVDHQRRFTFDEWMSPDLEGWYAHYNVPENDHWDTGTLDLTRLTPEEPEMELTDPVKLRNHRADGSFTGTFTDAPFSAAVEWTHDAAEEARAQAKMANAIAGNLQAEVQSLKNAVNAVLTLIQNGAAAPQPPANVDVKALAAAVADVLAQRLLS